MENNLKQSRENRDYWYIHINIHNKIIRSTLYKTKKDIKDKSGILPTAPIMILYLHEYFLKIPLLLPIQTLEFWFHKIPIIN